MDDNKETYMDRYNTYMEKTSPLIDFYEKHHIPFEINLKNNCPK